MNVDDDRAFDQRLRDGLPAAPPAEVEERLGNQLADFRARLTTREPAVERRAWPPSGARRTALAAAAAIVAVVAIDWALRPRSTFADVAAAVFKQPWVHVREVSPGKDRNDTWISSPKRIFAYSGSMGINFHDYAQRLHYSYDPAEGTLYRLPETRDEARRGKDIEMTIGLLVAVAEKADQAEISSDVLAFLGPRKSQGVKIIDQKLARVTEGDRAWLDYHLTMRHPALDEPLQAQFRVDPETKLLARCRLSGREGGQPRERTIEFDYPETGPADVYALGVPKDAPLVDRVPAGDLKRIDEAMQAGRLRMDNYRALFVETCEGLDEAWWQASPRVFYRQGSLFRADGPAFSTSPLPERPAADVDVRRFWQDRAAAFTFCPQTIVRGETTYRMDNQTVTDADGTLHAEITAVNEYTSPGDFFPPEYSLLPEYACRPPLGLGAAHAEATIELHPADGPPGCILVRVRNTASGKNGLPDEWRYWLDPQRDDIALRWQMVTFDDAGNETVTADTVIEETARSPQGIWYATKIRRKNVGQTADGKPFDQLYHLYVDFTAELPDALFDVPPLGRLR